MKEDHVLQIHRQKNALYRTTSYHRDKFGQVDKVLPYFDESGHHKIVLPLTL